MGKQALEGTRLNAFAMDPDDLVIIGLDTDDSEEHHLYDKRIHLKVDEGMVRNVMVYGVVQAVTVTKIGDTPCVVAGRQRVRAARVANERLLAEGKESIRVPVMLKKGEEHRLYGFSISENENRQDDNIIQKAENVARFLDMGRGEDEAAITFGVTKTTIKNWLAVLETIPAVRRAVEQGLLSATAAAKLAGLSPEDQLKALEELLASGKATVARTKNVVSNANGGDKSMTPGKRKLLKLVGHEEAIEELGEDFIRGVRFAIGDLDAKAVKGLKGLLDSI